MRVEYRLIITLFFVLYLSTFLPNFGFLNNLDFIGPFPEPMSYVLSVNAINTMIIFFVYNRYFKRFCKACDKEFSEGE